VTRPLWLAWLLLVGTTVQAAELTHFIAERKIGARVHALAFPESLRKDLRSGLTNRLLVRASLLQGDQPRGTALVEIALKYDLWDEKFRTELSINGATAIAPSLRTVEEAVAWLSDLRLPGLFDVPAASGTFTLSAEALLNPIERERLERIREWVKENSNYVPLDGSLQGRTPESGSNAIFNRIFEQYAAGDDVAAQWRREVVSAPFTVSQALPP
jgi:hypothetical protein